MNRLSLRSLRVPEAARESAAEAHVEPQVGVLSPAE